ncbi:variant erythrocyte surface antigen-1 family protein [Babesia caballi]|uniref:Variant erythrocyte surface antigen-1 family protein n=1 Tax=Babesia caballi TaxID=5871 RepID=A0AAV4LP22_BABCB|nr:variant erythrocyte surface antigen-1 family protein [Babesia caballi]
MSLADCPSNLKEAIDRILRVTGKDGQDQGGGGTQAITALTEQVKVLLDEVKNSASGTGVDIDKVTEVLGNSGTGNGLITSLAEGLQRFIGYKNGNNNHGHITVAGIAPSNMATHRLCDATIAFTIGMLEGFKRHRAINANGNLNKVNTVIIKLHEQYGKGTTGLAGLSSTVQSQLANSGNQWPGLDGFVTDFIESFKTNITNLSDSADNVATKVGAYLKGVFQKWSSDGGNGIEGKLKALVEAFNSYNIYNPEKGNNQINAVAGALNPQAGVVKPILTAGKNAFMDTLKRANYTRMDYEASTKIQWNSDTTDVKTCAKIFMGCLPLYYQALTYIYWGCHANGGGWRNLTLAGGDLKSYFDSQGLLPSYVDKSKRGAHVAASALKGFEEFQAAASSIKDSNSPYATFAQKLQENVGRNSNNLTSNCPLSALFYGASCYFRYQQITKTQSAVSAPKTIREMLYFLAALQFSSAYENINGHIDTLLTNQLDVADSSQKDPDNKLSADQLKEYLRASCAFSSSVLGLIQGPGASQKSEPWLYELFCNSAFHFKYPSSRSTLFITVSNYAYALQFQLIFLYSMCGNIGLKCGWQECTYGSEIKGSGNSLQSHICSGFKCRDPSQCNHKKGGGGTNCNHNNYNDTNGCGKSDETPSPLQAFITGALPSFGLSSSSTPNHMSDHPQGALCHVPMGFQANHLRSIGNGAAVYSVLKSICGNFSSPLRQLCEKLGCLTKRTPRSLGDLFGFTWHLKGQLYNTRSSDPATHNWVTKLANLTPFSSTVKEHINVLQTFVGSSQSHSSSHGTHDLKSLSNSKCNQQIQTCGPYLSPLTLSDGATFGKPAPYASTYLSWMVYLTDDLQSGFQELLEEFKNIDCKKSGCRKSSIGQTKCEQSHATGTHGTSDQSCKCYSVVHCGGVLPLLYRYGFTFGSTGDLFGEGTYATNTKRDCKAFAAQLQSVITGKPLQDLFESIDTFLFVFRYYFLGNLSGFWTIYTCLILYTFFFLLDTLHLRSHLKLTASHMVPPLSLLTSGHPVPVTKLTYVTQ